MSTLLTLPNNPGYFFGPVEARPVNRSLMLAISISVAVHGLILALHFKFPDISKRLGSEALEIILVNARSSKAPLKPQAYAQANLDGGGNTEENRRAATPLPATRYQVAGAEVEQVQRRVKELEAQQQLLSTKVKSANIVAGQKSTDGKADPNPRNGKDDNDLARAMSRLEGEIAKSLEEYNKRPKKKFLSPRTLAYAAAMYLEDWRVKVERIGNLNYPVAARGRFYGAVVLNIELRRDGSLYNVEVARSSGHRILDDAALRIVQLGQPFGPVPPAALEGNDILNFTRTMNFTHDNTPSVH